MIFELVLAVVVFFAIDPDGDGIDVVDVPLGSEIVGDDEFEFKFEFGLALDADIAAFGEAFTGLLETVGGSFMGSIPVGFFLPLLLGY